MLEAFNILVERINGSFDYISHTVRWLLLALMVVGIITQSIKAMFGQATLGNLGGYLLYFIKMAVMVAIISNFHFVITTVLRVFVSIGSAVAESGVGVNANAVENIVKDPFLVVSAFTREMYRYFVANTMDGDAVGLAINRLIIALGTGTCLFLLIKSCSLVALSILEFYLVALFGMIYLPFIAIPQWQSYAEKSIGGMLGAALKCAVVICLATIITPLLINAIEYIVLPKSLSQYIFHIIMLLSISILFNLLVEYIPRIIHNALSGIPHLSSATANQTMVSFSPGGKGLTSSVGRELVGIIRAGTAGMIGGKAGGITTGTGQRSGSTRGTTLREVLTQSTSLTEKQRFSRSFSPRISSSKTDSVDERGKASQHARDR